MKEKISDYFTFQPKIARSDLWILLFCCVLIAPFFYEDFASYYHKKGLIRFVFFAFYQYFNPLMLVYILVYFLLPVFIKNKNIFLFIIVLLFILIIQGFLARVVYGLIAGRYLNINHDTITSEMQFSIMLAAPMAMILFIK